MFFRAVWRFRLSKSPLPFPLPFDVYFASPSGCDSDGGVIFSSR
jgi:hypothetical protein